MSENSIEPIELEQLDDKDIATLIKSSDYTDYLMAFKLNANRPPFSNYSAQLGRFIPGSEIVKKSLPNIATKLYRKHEHKSALFVEQCFSYRKTDFTDAIKEVFDQDISVPLLSDISYDDAKKVIK